MILCYSEGMLNQIVATESTNNIIWAKEIPRTNKVFLIFFLLLVFGVDLMIILNSPDLFGFWVIMLVLFVGFCVFFYIENYIFSKKLTASRSSLDSWIFLVVILRNLLFLLNFILFIQLLGLIGLPTAGSGLLVAYIVLIVLRMRALRNAVTPASLSAS